MHPRPLRPVAKMDPSPALQIIGKMKDTLDGTRDRHSDRGWLGRRRHQQGQTSGDRRQSSVKIVAPKVGGAKLADGSLLAADGQLAGTPSVLFDAVAVILSAEGAKALSKESAAIDFVRDAFGHLKAIAVDNGGQALLKAANVGADAGVVDAKDMDAFIAAAKTRQWNREKSVRTLP